MALMRFDFKHIRTIICMQGYPLDYQFYIREIGFWSRNISGSIPLNVKISNHGLDPRNQQTIFYFEEEVHGIKFRKTFENGLPFSEMKTILKCIYLMTNCDELDSNFIGICKDEKISGILAKANLGKYVVELDNLEVFKRNSVQFPSDDVIKYQLATNPSDYPICQLHGPIKNNETPFCSRSKAKFLAGFCKQVGEQEYKT